MAAEKLDPSDANPEGGSVEEYECFLKDFSRILHPNHVVMVDRKYNLAKMYGRMPGFEADVMTDEQLRRKKQLCEEVLLVFNKIIPGRMRKKGEH